MDLIMVIGVLLMLNYLFLKSLISFAQLGDIKIVIARRKFIGFILSFIIAGFAMLTYYLIIKLNMIYPELLVYVWFIPTNIIYGILITLSFLLFILAVIMNIITVNYTINENGLIAIFPMHYDNIKKITLRGKVMEVELKNRYYIKTIHIPKDKVNQVVEEVGKWVEKNSVKSSRGLAIAFE